MEKNHRIPLVSGSISRQSDSSRRSSSWLGTSVGSGSRLMRDLDEDPVDREILDEEIHYRHHHESAIRRKIMRVLESNPMQVLLYVLVVLDAGVVIAEILLDLHAMRSQYQEARADLIEAMNFLKDVYSQDLDGYSGDNIHYILDTLRKKHLTETMPFPFHSSCINSSSGSSFPSYSMVDHSANSGAHISASQLVDSSLGANHKSPNRLRRGPMVFTTPKKRGDNILRVIVGGDGVDTPVSPPEYLDDRSRIFNKHSMHRTVILPSSPPALEPNQLNRTPVGPTRPRGERIAISEYHQRGNRGRQRRSFQVVADPTDSFQILGSQDPSPSPSNHSTFSGLNPNSSDSYYRKYSYANNLLKIAHMLHYVGIGILGFFVVQVFLKLYVMGCEFFRKKLELFDAIIVLTSFSLDLVFVEGITGEQSEEAIALLIIFLLWRILRIINGIMVTSKKRQDLLIQLQKRARRRAEKKTEYLEDDRIWKEREIHNLRELCTERGATEEEISRCKPRRRTILQKMDTSMGLSSIATLSLGLSMSMAGAGRAVIRTLGTVPGSLDSRQGLQQLFPVLPLGVPLVPRSNTRRSVAGLTSSFQATKWRSRMQSERRSKSKAEDDLGRGSSIDSTPASGRHQDGGGDGGSQKDSADITTIDRNSANSSVDASLVETPSKQRLDSTGCANISADGRFLEMSRLQSQFSYDPVLIPDVIVHAAEALTNDRQQQTSPDASNAGPAGPPPPPPPPPKKEPDRCHDRTNSAERRNRNRHLLGSRNPPSYSSSLPQLSLIRLATSNNNNNNNVKNVCNFSLSSISSRNCNSHRQQDVLNRENEERRQRSQLIGDETTEPPGVHSIVEMPHNVCDPANTNSSSPPPPSPTTMTTQCASKIDFNLPLSSGSPICLSGSSSTQSEIVLMENHPYPISPPSYEDAKRHILSSYPDTSNAEWSQLYKSNETGRVSNTRPKSKRPSIGFWRCSKSQELQPKSGQENISSAGFKTRYRSINSMTKSHDFF